ncbi:transcriptional regulator [endosymbiont 'TC1' of Trimyema compressum]|uniref:YebC/PmpR family DNA-binding transcriptional regulator n=1 Tax=endosymbiont 'TC1' of Trimyema compressum TaxID=243899 RepID=UPI0007F0A1EE|nr:YebC/PmpR family DNA-binding transcriptional regulator [endosymbiont 'TC1' of Trimyema compressum]AMP20031.1 transcriptional regulator [endosymbiont 'TC1' of Trimyema compressum]
MAGHSKWANIKHKKGKQDAKRAKIFTKIGKEIMVSVKLGGIDPEGNSKLALQNARANNMPNDNIKRLIQRASGEDNSTQYEELVYEGYGIGGAAVIVDVMTDNRNRTAGEIRHIFDKCGGNLGETGSVAWLFERKGQLTITLENQDEDFLTLEAIEAGAEDVVVEGDELIIFTAMEDFDKVRKIFEDKNIAIGQAMLTKISENTIEITDIEQAKQLIKMMDLLEDNDDVQDTYSNFDFSEEIMWQL